MKRIFALLTAAALLLSGCGKQPAQTPTPVPEEQPPVEQPVQEEQTPQTPDPQKPEGQPEEPTAPEQGAAVALCDLLEDIAGVAPGTAGSSLRLARAAGEFLDWAQHDAQQDTTDVWGWIDDHIPAGDAAALALAWSMVQDRADQLLAGDEMTLGELDAAGYTLQKTAYDAVLVTAAARQLSLIYTNVLQQGTAEPCPVEAPGDYAAITLDALEGVWRSNGCDTLLVITGGACRVYYPLLDMYGEAAYGVRVRDRSSMGYCPALEMDFRQSGTFEAPLTYYVSGIDDTHFWCSAGSERFEKLA